MSSEEDAQNAISKLNGQTVEGRALTVNEARPREQRPPGGGGGRGYGGGGYGGRREGGGGQRRGATRNLYTALGYACRPDKALPGGGCRRD